MVLFLLTLLAAVFLPLPVCFEMPRYADVIGIDVGIHLLYFGDMLSRFRLGYFHTASHVHARTHARTFDRVRLGSVWEWLYVGYKERAHKPRISCQQ